MAASSAFPVYLSPVALKNYSAEQPQPEPEWIKAILEDPAASGRLKYLALQARSYMMDAGTSFICSMGGCPTISDYGAPLTGPWPANNPYDFGGNEC